MPHTASNPRPHRTALLLLALAVAACTDGLTAPVSSAESSRVTTNSSGYTWSDLGTLGGARSVASGINAGGTVVGWSNNSIYGNGGLRPVAWYFSGPYRFIRDLGTLPGDAEGKAAAINAAGTIVGYSTDAQELHAHPVVFNPSGSITALPTGGKDGLAVGINDAGTIVGYLYCACGSYVAHAAMWSPTGALTLLPEPAGTIESTAWKVSNGDYIAGSVRFGTGGFQPYRWKIGGGGKLLAIPGGFGEGMGVNTAGHVSGKATGFPSGARGFVWSGGTPVLRQAPEYWALSDMERAAGTTFTLFNGVESALPGPGNAVVLMAQDVNSCGSMAGLAQFSNSSWHAMLWTKPACD